MSASDHESRRQALATLASIVRDAAVIRRREVIPRVITPQQAAAGAEWVTAVPGGVVWSVQAVSFTFTTSAVAGNRSSALAVTDGTNTVARIASQGSQAAASVKVFSSFRGSTATLVNGLNTVENIPAVGFPLLGGWRIGSQTEVIDGGDQYSAVAVYVLEVEERSYSVEAEYDIATLLNAGSNAVPELDAWL